MEAGSEKILIEFCHFPVLSLGPGRRVGIWVRGCTIHCPDCIAEYLWSFDESRAREVEDVAREVEEFFSDDGNVDGVTISGGEPFDQPEALIALLKKFRAKDIRDILLYTGYDINEITSANPEISELAAAVVDSPFQLGEDTEDAWKGSSNQTLTVFDRQLSGRYEKWRGTKKGPMQVAVLKDRVISIGIPRQADVPRMGEMIIKKMTGEGEAL